MNIRISKAGALGAGALLAATLMGAQASGAFAQDELLAQAAIPTVSDEPIVQAPSADDAVAAPAPVFVSEPVIQAIPEGAAEEDAAANARPASLAGLVAATPTDGDLSRDMRCLAGAIYFESKGEPLAGQLAVGRVIINRAESDRFPDTYCDVVLQRKQFSFVRGGRIPAINEASKAWRNAKAIARIAHEGSWESQAPGAMFFHATYVSPKWRLTRVARIKNHIFYR